MVGVPRSLGNSNGFHQIPDFLGRLGSQAAHRVRDDKVKHHAQRSDPFRRNTEPPVGGRVGSRIDELEINNVAGGESDTGDHSGNGAFLVHAF